MNSKELEEKQLQIDKELKQIEKQIFELETVYFDETCNSGNIIKGWDQYLLSKSNKGQIVQNIKKPKIQLNERIFSLSSITSPAQPSYNYEENPASQQNSVKQKTNISNSVQYRPQRTKKKKNYQNIVNMNDSNVFEQKMEFGMSEDESDQQNDSQAETPLKVKKNIKKNKKQSKKIKGIKI